MKYFYIGSRALDLILPDEILIRKNIADRDHDILVHSSVDKTEAKLRFKQKFGDKVEIHQCDILWHALDEARTIQRIVDILFTLKVSHVMFHKHHKDKTLHDIVLLCEFGKIDEELFFNLYEYWCTLFGTPWRADFTKESSDFFNDAVSREHQHDELHLTVAKFPQPAFKYLQNPDQTTVWVCPDKFRNADDDLKRQVIIEEAQVLALERDIIPGRCKHPQLSYIKKVYDLIDRLAPLWMIPYIAQNLKFFITHKQNYYDQIKL
jgi:hypothetical protein